MYKTLLLTSLLIFSVPLYGVDTPSRIAVTTSRNPFWDRASVGSTFFVSALGKTAQQRFDNRKPGISFNWKQHIHSVFWGSVTASLENWKTKETFVGGGDIYLFPARFGTDVTIEAPLWLLSNNDSILAFHPFMRIGFGYLSIFAAQDTPQQATTTLRGEVAVSLSGGILYALTKQVALTTFWEHWQGAESSRFSATSVHLGFQIGDFGRE